jgi:hypothetical protein
VVNENGLQPVVWGEATNCMARVDVGNLTSVNLFLNLSSIELYLYRGLRMGGDTTFLFKLTGEVGTDQQRQPVDVDFRASTDSLDVRLPVADGSVIASVNDNGQVELQTRNGPVVYDPTTMTCVSQSTTGMP